MATKDPLLLLLLLRSTGVVHGSHMLWASEALIIGWRECQLNSCRHGLQI